MTARAIKSSAPGPVTIAPRASAVELDAATRRVLDQLMRRTGLGELATMKLALANYEEHLGPPPPPAPVRSPVRRTDAVIPPAAHVDNVLRFTTSVMADVIRSRRAVGVKPKETATVFSAHGALFATVHFDRAQHHDLTFKLDLIPEQEA